MATTIAEMLEQTKQEVFISHISDPGFCDPATFDAAILGAPIHVGKYPPAFEQFIQNWQSSLASIPTAMVSVSLAIASKNPEEVEEAKNYPRELFERANWQADAVYNAAGALKYVEYNFFKRWMMRRIVKNEGGPIDTSRDHELTDWEALEEFVDGFVKMVKSDIR